MPPSREQARTWQRANNEDGVLDWWCKQNEAAIGDHRDDWEAWKATWRASPQVSWDTIVDLYLEHHRARALKNRHTEDEFEWWAGGQSVLMIRTVACSCRAVERRPRDNVSPAAFMRLQRQCAAHAALTPGRAWDACKDEADRIGTVETAVRDLDPDATFEWSLRPGDPRVLEVRGLPPAIAADVEARVALRFGPGVVDFR